MSELAVTAIKVLYLALLWLFILSVVSVIRSDLFGRTVPNPTPADEPQPLEEPARAKKATVSESEDRPRPVREVFKTKSGAVTVELPPESDDKVLLKALREVLAIVTARGKSVPTSEHPGQPELTGE